jgi:hypothetical protein
MMMDYEQYIKITIYLNDGNELDIKLLCHFLFHLCKYTIFLRRYMYLCRIYLLVIIDMQYYYQLLIITYTYNCLQHVTELYRICHRDVGRHP